MSRVASKQIECQVAVAGGGFSGLLLALLLQRQGVQTAVFEQARYPRFAIGESSTPLANQILRRLARDYDVPQLDSISRFRSWRSTYPEVTNGLKRGFAYFGHQAGRRFQVAAEGDDRLMVTASLNDDVGDTQWLRADVDEWFARLAESFGVELFQGCRVEGIERRRNGWQIEARGDDIRIGCRCFGWLVDATGPAATVARSQGVRPRTDSFHTHSSCVYTHLVDLQRWETILQRTGIDTTVHPFRCDDAAVHHLVKEGWIWQLRFVDGRTSVGLVRSLSHPQSGNSQPTTLDDWNRCVARYPELAEWLSQARLADEPGRWISTGRLQRKLDTACGDSWVALPYTYAFVDPLHSTGIAWSLSGVAKLAELLGGSNGSVSQRGLSEYAASLALEASHVDRIIAMAYAAMPSWKLFHATAMVYFAAATSSERDETTGDLRGFLGSNRTDFDSAVKETLQMVESTDIRDATAVTETVRWIEQRLEPLNDVGLFQPELPGLYWRTAAPLVDPGS